MRIVCSRCGHPNAQSAIHCENCGQQLHKTSSSQGRGRLRSRIASLGGKPQSSPKKASWESQLQAHQFHNEQQRQELLPVEVHKKNSPASWKSRVIGIVIALIALAIFLSLTIGWPIPLACSQLFLWSLALI